VRYLERSDAGIMSQYMHEWEVKRKSLIGAVGGAVG